MVSVEIVSVGRPNFFAKRPRKNIASCGMSPARLRSGGTRSSTTLSR